MSDPEPGPQTGPRTGPADDRLAERYGRSRKPRWPIAAAVVVVLLALAWLGWAIWGQATPEVTSGLVSYEVTGEHSADVTVQVHLSDTDVRATCLVQAQAYDHSPVGELHFRVPRDRGRTMRLTETIRTDRKATAVVLTGCTAPGQEHPR